MTPSQTCPDYAPDDFHFDSRARLGACFWVARVLAVVPVRYEDERFPGKVLASLAGRPVLQYVLESLAEVEQIDRVVVGTDDERVRSVAEGLGAEVLITVKDHRTGSDRLAEVAEYCGEDYEIVMNVHGNLPGVRPELLRAVLDLKLEHRSWEVATAARPFLESEDPLSPTAVKVVMTKRNRALYFSRSLIPFPRARTDLPIYRHIGVYAYEREALLRFQTLPQSHLEESESLEQLRVLENDGTVGIFLAERAVPSVSAPEDLNRVAALMREHGVLS